MILIHQMAKVASLSWVEAARPAAAEAGYALLHTHFLAEPNLARLAQALAAPPELQTIANPLIPRDILRKGRAAAAALAQARADGRTVRLACGMRDPVARSLSLYSFLADFCGHKRQALGGRDLGATVDGAAALLRATWEAVYAGTAPEDSFGWLLWRLVGLFRSWFDEELLQPLGANLDDAEPAPGGGALRLRSGNLDLLVYRVEDMQPGAPGYDALRAAAAEFLGVPVPAWPAVNQERSRRRSQDFNEALRRGFRLPAELLDAIYAEPVVRRFYSAQEVAAFRRQWSF